MLLPKKITNGRFKDSLAQQDIRFVVTTLSEKGAEADSLLHLLTDGAMRDVILDNPKLLEKLEKLKSPLSFALPISTELYFYLLLRPALKKVGLDRPELAAYIADALANFPPAPRPGVHTSDYVEALRAAQGYEWFGLSIELANRSVILSGIYSTEIYQKKKGYTVAGLNYYENLGKNCYYNASTHQLAGEFALKGVLRTMEEQFNVVREVLISLRDRCVGVITEEKKK